MDDSKKPSGCSVLALYGGMFRRRKFWHRRSSSTSSIPRCNPGLTAKLPSSDSMRVRSGSDDTALIFPAHLSCPAVTKSPVKSKTSAPNYYHKATRRTSDSPKALPGPVPNNGLSGEHDSMVYDHQRAKGSNTLVRATSGNVMLFGNLGNIRGNLTNSPNRNVLDYLPKTANELGMNGNGRNGYGFSGANGVMGNIVKKNTAKEAAVEVAPVLCRALSKRLDPEELKEMGNEEYKKGRFAEALAFYDRAIVIDPEKASYWSNKAAALTGLGRLLEAVGECKEAVRIDPSYCRAHHRLATLYLRLGEADKAVDHYKLSRSEASSTDISGAQALQACIAKCNEARRLGDWNKVLKEAQSTVSAGADSAPQVFASQAEALLKLDRHEEAESVLNRAPKFDIDASTKFFSATKNAYTLMIRAEVDIASGRFEDAVGIAQRAAQLDPSNREMSAVVRRTRAVASARSKGNDLFKASKFGEACITYGEGLDHVPRNATLLCNRAACRSKIGQWERAIEDCNAALIVRPSYSKARLRRADCNTKLERWEAVIRDYEVLINEIPGDEELSKALVEAQAKLKQQRAKIDIDATES